MKTSVTFNLDTDNLPNVTDSHLVALWHIAQANPADINDRDAGELAEYVGREIIRRFVAKTAPELWNHQGRHHFWTELTKHCKWVDDVWQLKQDGNGEVQP